MATECRPAAREETMKDLRASRRLLLKKWHRREKATIDHLVNVVDSKGGTDGRTLSPMTSTGLIVEEQVRKAWQPYGLGLAVF
jgi:UTP:GlnB (protein PII) uridylyltransferase